jgi:hypothetical protein
MVLLFYVDEFGDHSMGVSPEDPWVLKEGVSEWFILSAVGIRDSSRKPLAEAIFELKRRHFGSDMEMQPWGSSEIKGRFLMRAARSAASGHVLTTPRAYQALDSPQRVAALISDVSLIFSKFRPLIFAIAIDKTALLRDKGKRKKSGPPLGIAYTYLQQRVALTMEKVHSGEGAILVADQQTQHESFFRSGEMNAVRDRMTKRLPIQPSFNLVLDKPLWIDTQLSSWDREVLQLPDVVAYSVATYLARGTAPTEACYMWDRIRAQLAVQWSTGDVESGGLAIVPKPPSYPPM